MALLHFSQSFILDVQPEPINLGNKKEIDPTITKLIKFYQEKDTSTQPKISIPVITIHAIARGYQFSVHHSAVAYLVTISYFLFYKVGEYTQP